MSRDDEGGIVDGWMPPLLPEGYYTLRFIDWATRIHLGRSYKLVMRLAICDPGEHFETLIERWYNVRKLVGPARRRGRFKAGWSSDLYREYSLIAGEPQRRDRIALLRLHNRLLGGRVETVTKDRNQRPLHPSQQYSVLRSIEPAAT